MTAPSRVMFLFSCCILLSFPFLRLTCADEVEDILAVVVMLTTAPYFLFFCRGFKSVGPFVVMIYRMIMGDLLRFVSIYLVFVLGFSQGKHLASPFKFVRKLKSVPRTYYCRSIDGWRDVMINIITGDHQSILPYKCFLLIANNC